MSEALRAALHMLSQRGWDRVGDPGATPIELHHNGTLETVRVMPDEVLLWVAQLAPVRPPAPPLSSRPASVPRFGGAMLAILTPTCRRLSMAAN